MGRFFVAMALALALFAGCSAVPENHYFTMAYVLVPPKTPPKAYPFSVRLRPLELSSAYDTERIVYRYSPYEFQYYNYMLWAAKPAKMVTDMLVRYLQHAGLFQDVNTEYGDRRPDFEMSGTLEALEELDSGAEWYAHLALTVRLSRGDAVVWSHEINARKQVYNKEPVYVVRALSELMEIELIKLTEHLAQYLGTQKRVSEESAP